MRQIYSKYYIENLPKIPQSSTGKERDSETGFSYFGARYYDSDILTGWLSVDPMADKYPNISPYAYCGWNPVKLVDPDGRDWYIPEGQNIPTYDKNITANNCPKGASYIGKTAHWFGSTENDMQYYYHGSADGSITQQDMIVKIYDSFSDYNFEFNYGISDMICDYYGETSKKWLKTSNSDKHKIMYTMSKNGLLGDTKPGSAKTAWDKFAKNNYKKIGYAGTVFSGIDITTSLMEDGWTVGVNTAGSIGSATGGWVGAKAGASLGAFIGSSFLGVGTVIGAGIGAIIGGVGGGVLGDYVGKEAYKLF